MRFRTTLLLATCWSLVVSNGAHAGSYRYNYRLCEMSYLDEQSAQRMSMTQEQFAEYLRSKAGRFYKSGIRRVCSDWARHPNPDQLADFEQHFNGGGSSEAANAAASFMLGVVTGFIGSYNPGGGGGGAVRGGTVRPGTRVVSHGTTTYRPAGIASSPVRTTPVTTSTVRTTTTTRSAGAPIGYITQPNGTKDPYYSKQPCATTKQTGPTSYECTNK